MRESVPRRHNQTHAPQQTALAFDHLVRAEGHPRYLSVAGRDRDQTRHTPFAERALRNIRWRTRYSGLMLAARITLPHFSVSSAMNFPKSAGVIGIGVPARSSSRAFIFGSARAALISL